MRCADVPEVPGLGRNAGQRGFVGAVALDKAVLRGRAPERPADAVIGEGRADEIDLLGRLGQVNCETALMLAAAGPGDVGAGEGFALFGERIVPDLLLLGVAAPARDRHNPPIGPDGGKAGGQHPGGLRFEQDVRRGFHRRGQRDSKPARQRVFAVDKGERPGAHGGKIRHVARPVNGAFGTAHAGCTPSSIILASSGSNSSPAARIMPG